MILGRPPALQQPRAGVIPPRGINLMEAQRQAQNMPAASEPVTTRAAQGAAMADVFGNPDAARPTAAPGLLTGAARVVELLMQHRGALQAREREETERTREEKDEQGRRDAMAQALAAYNGEGDDASRHQAMIAALGQPQGAPELGLELAQERIGNRMDLAEALAAEEQQTPVMVDRQRQVGDVQVEQAVRQAQRVAPYQARAQQPNAPAGYRWREDGTMEPVPGGPAEVRVTHQQRAAVNAAMSRIEDGQRVLGYISRARQQAGSGETGLVGSIMQNLPGTRAHDLDATLDTIRANLGFEALAEMRANSPTGGALGQVTERELAFLQAVMTNLRQSQSREQFLDNLDALERGYVASMQRVQQAYLQDFGQELPQPQATQQQPAQGGVRRYNPQTGRIE